MREKDKNVWSLVKKVEREERRKDWDAMDVMGCNGMQWMQRDAMGCPLSLSGLDGENLVLLLLSFSPLYMQQS